VRLLRRRRRPIPIVSSTFLRGDLVWLCHFCDEERLDEHIAVVQAVRRMAGGVEMTLARRYCRDRPNCRDAAYRWAELCDEFGRMPK
jgi:hypothetical protein